MEISMYMNDADMDALCSSSMMWDDTWSGQVTDGRFEHATARYDQAPSYKWARAYWVGESWANVMLIRAYLGHMGHTYEVLWDQATSEYVMLTNYTTASMRKDYIQ